MYTITVSDYITLPAVEMMFCNAHFYIWAAGAQYVGRLGSEAKGSQFKPEHAQSAAEVLLSKAPNPPL